jgi:hypothetical protein
VRFWRPMAPPIVAFGNPTDLSRKRERSAVGRKPASPGPAGWLISAFEMPGSSHYHLQWWTVRRNAAATRSAIPSARWARAALRSLTIRSGITTQGNRGCLARAQDSFLPVSRCSVWRHDRSEPLSATHSAVAAACFLQSPQLRDLRKMEIRESADQLLAPHCCMRFSSCQPPPAGLSRRRRDARKDRPSPWPSPGGRGDRRTTCRFANGEGKITDHPSAATSPSHL